jgi:hypothetical protein
MTSAELINRFEQCITDSVIDSVTSIERQFALTQSECGWHEAINALAMAFVIADRRRHFLENAPSLSVSGAKPVSHKPE